MSDLVAKLVAIPSFSRQYTISLNTLRSVRRLHWSTVNEHSFHSVEMIVTPNVVVREIPAVLHNVYTSRTIRNLHLR